MYVYKYMTLTVQDGVNVFVVLVLSQWHPFPMPCDLAVSLGVPVWTETKVDFHGSLN